MSLPYQTYRSYLKKRYGEEVLKVPVNGGFSCPNKKDGPGCTFCDNRSFSPAALKSTEVVEEFLKVQRRSKRYKKFIPYLQPNTNTYAPVEQLRAIYEPLIAQEGVVGLALGTRPDALDEEVCDYLAEVNERTYLSVEVGLQSSNNTTLDRIARGHSFEEFVAGVERLASRGIEVVTHLMVGLPGEGEEEALASARAVAQLPIQGVKIHQLMIIEHTLLADEFVAGEIGVLDLPTYAQIVGKMLEELRPDMYMHRLVADAKPEFGLIAPLWSADKDASMVWLQNYLKEHNILQGRHWKGYL